MKATKNAEQKQQQSRKRDEQKKKTNALGKSKNEKKIYQKRIKLSET